MKERQYEQAKQQYEKTLKRTTRRKKDNMREGHYERAIQYTPNNNNNN